MESTYYRLMGLTEDKKDIQWSVYSLQFIVCSLQFTVCSLQFAVYSLQFAVYSLLFTVCSLKFTVYSLKLENSSWSGPLGSETYTPLVIAWEN